MILCGKDTFYSCLLGSFSVEFPVQRMADELQTVHGEFSCLPFGAMFDHIQRVPYSNSNCRADFFFLPLNRCTSSPCCLEFCFNMKLFQCLLKSCNFTA